MPRADAGRHALDKARNELLDRLHSRRTAVTQLLRNKFGSTSFIGKTEFSAMAREVCAHPEPPMDAACSLTPPICSAYSWACPSICTT